MKAKTGQIFHNGSIRYLLVEVRLDQEALPELGRGRYAMVISGHRELGRLWAFEGQEYYTTWKVVEDVGFLETGETGFLETDYYPPGVPFVARVLRESIGKSHDPLAGPREEMLIKSMDGHFFGMNGCFYPPGRIMWEKRPAFHEFVWSESLPCDEPVPETITRLPQVNTEW
jgi:hypothetical protein